MSLPSTGRQRLACDECTRKKIKCDKTIPCSNCTKRGLQDTCNRSGESEIFRQPSIAPISHDDGPAQKLDATGLTALVASLSTRLSELERAVKGTPSREDQPQFPDASTSSRPPQSDASGHNLLPVDSGLAYNTSRRLSPPAALHNATSADSEAASILEFLAWGRRKPDGHVAPTSDFSRIISSTIGDIEAETPSDLSNFAADHCIPFLQTLLPNRCQIEQLVIYHEDCLLWYHGSFFPPVFREQLDAFFDKHDGNLENRNVSLQWVALLFSVLAGSMCCAPPQTVKKWGFRDSEKATLSKQWHRAVITCLNAGDFMTEHQLVSCEAIATLTLPAHLLGCSNNQSVLLASAVRIAQSLGLHKLSSNAKSTEVERGRRVWCQLCTQDWFGIPFSESYSINPLYSQTCKPTNCHEDDMAVELPDSVPTRAAYPRFLYDIARLMPQLQDGILSSSTPYTAYEQVLKYDMHMRALATTKRPLFLSNTPVDPEWPRWVSWARRSLTISSAHKIITIHRQFLGQSFTSPPFSMTRKTCIAAAKTILKEQKQADDPYAPHLWIYDAFSVTACIILCFDLFYRNAEESDYAEHWKMIEDAVDILRNVDGSMIAKRGVRLLTALLSETGRTSAHDPKTPRKRKASGSGPAGGATKQQKFDVASFVRRFCDEVGQASSPSSGQNTPADEEAIIQTPKNQQSSIEPVERSQDSSLTYTERLLKEAQDRTRTRTVVSNDLLSPRGNFENVSSFENLLFLAQKYDI